VTIIVICRDCGCDVPQERCRGKYKERCDVCRPIAHRKAQAVASLRGYHRRRAQSEPARLKATKRLGVYCGLCLSMPWRVRGERCPACDLAHGPDVQMIPSGLRSAGWL
jgi:hypothetical protein